eukprot:CAMPEP_0116889364 /NCGR_PEP_ID=MMETSP0463-20121206/24789_1 /TAXON_ID=181622 /ORGANISM="Strombidinopsis sp, Strain SopsisLIS2011" /LENGTH=43 /DNA_ID= /DNA_START= /DNA_END= /DNA_ORIENTATION=
MTGYEMEQAYADAYDEMDGDVLDEGMDLLNDEADGEQMDDISQ